MPRRKSSEEGPRVKTVNENDAQNEESVEQDDFSNEDDNSKGKEKGYNGPDLMDGSGQTDAERRALRRKQRNLFKEMTERDDFGVAEARERNNDLNCKVRYTREAVLDGENLILIARKTGKEVDRLTQVPRYDVDRLVSKLVQKCRSTARGHEYFDWAALGSEAGICFNAIPSRVSFLNGPLTDGMSKKKRAQQQRRQKGTDEDENLAATKPEDVQGNRKDADQLSAVESSMKLLMKTLKKRVDATYVGNKRRLQEHYGNSEIPSQAKKKLKKHGASICAMQYLINPKSFTQTVENIFHFSFLIKNAKASISVRHRELSENNEGILGQPGPVVRYCDLKGGVKSHGAPRQAIASLTMKDWRDLCKAYEVETGDLPNRTGSKFNKRLSQGMSQEESPSEFV